MQENVHRENRLSPFAGAGCRRLGGAFMRSSCLMFSVNLRGRYGRIW